MENMLPLIFMPVALGCFSKQKKSYIESIGILWESFDKAGPRSCNGYPGFFSFHILHKDDWEQARKIIIELDKQQDSVLEALSETSNDIQS